MPHRIISRLESAAECDPVFTPSKLKGSRAKGLAYQRQVEKELASLWAGVRSGQWFLFFDAFGRGHAQPDAFVVFPTHVLLFEIKLTQTHEAFLQMAQLYSPILEHVYKRPIMTVQICKILRYEPESPVSGKELTGLLLGNHTWHFFGR